MHLSISADGALADRTEESTDPADPNIRITKNIPGVESQIRNQIAQFVADHKGTDQLAGAVASHLAVQLTGQRGKVSVRAEVRIAVHATS